MVKIFEDRPCVRLKNRTVLALLLCCLGACSFGDSNLAALQGDPMAEFVPPGTNRVFRSDVSESTYIDMPIPAEVFRSFLILERDDADSVLDEVIEFAESVGWTFYELEPDIARASKDLEAGEGRLTISLHADQGGIDDGGPLQVTINLEYDE